MSENDSDSKKNGGYVDCKFGDGNVFPFGQHIDGIGDQESEIWLML